MTIQNTFNLIRLSHLIFNDVMSLKKPISIVAAILIIFSLFSPLNAINGFSTYFALLYIGGFIVTSFAFNDLHERSKAHLFLMLPCSNFERFLNKWLLSGIGYALSLLIAYYLFSFINGAINLLVFEQHIPTINLLQSVLWIGIGKYLILQSVILLGAIMFRKYVLIKTALVVGCFFLIFTIFSAAINLIVLFPDYSQGELLMHTAHKIGHFIFWVLLAPFCWTITYLRLTEYELV